MHNSYCTPTQTCRFLINPIVFAWSSGTFSKFVVLRFVNISPEILSIASTDVFSVSGTFAKTSILCSDDEVVHNCGNFCADAESFPFLAIHTKDHFLFLTNDKYERKILFFIHEV